MGKLDPTRGSCGAGLVMQPLNPLWGGSGIELRNYQSGRVRIIINPNLTCPVAIPNLNFLYEAMRKVMLDHGVIEIMASNRVD